MDILDQPHTLICGTTGSGKSTVLDALIYTALLKHPYKANTPDNFGFILIDPKSRLSKFEKLPHTISYSVLPKDCLAALNASVNIMMKRFDDIRKRGLEDYDGGHIYVIIDEFYPLVTSEMVKKKAVVSAIQQLGALGRAANVHVILCSQRPTTDIIPGSITANFDARLGLRTVKAQHSRNIIEQNGCEQLPQYGQGFYLNANGLTLYNLPMIEKEDISNRIKWWVDQKLPEIPAEPEKPVGLFARLFKK